MTVPGIRRRWKGVLLGSVLHGYLALRRLIVQRTKLVDEAQDRLLALLEELTTGMCEFLCLVMTKCRDPGVTERQTKNYFKKCSGTEAETRDFIAACIQTVDKYPFDDMLTPVFIFERLCSIIFPVRSLLM